MKPRPALPDILAQLQTLADPETARGLLRFFKTGPGQYGEGDLFLGIKVPPLRKLARELEPLESGQVAELLRSPYHEARLLALMLLCSAFARGNEAERQLIFTGYLEATRHINNWDLVDLSAPTIVGGHLADKGRTPLYRLAQSNSLWERRIAIVSTWHFIRRGDLNDTLEIAGRLLTDREDLIHKATGWMLREVGKRDLAALQTFLQHNYAAMPRTTLRYAIERFPPELRQAYLRGEFTL